MKRLLAFVALIFPLIGFAPAYSQVGTAVAVSSCGTPPLTYTAGQFYPLTQDTTGKFCGASSVTGTAGINQTQLNGVALGSPSNYGTSPGAVAVQGINAFVTNTVLNTPSASSASTAGIAPVNSAAAESCHVLKASAGNLYSASGVIGAAGYIMVFNLTSAPSNGAVTPVAWVYVPVQGAWSISYNVVPLYLATGVVVCASSTGPFTLTLYSTNTAFSGQVQ